MKRLALIGLLAIGALSGCAGKVDYVRPTVQPSTSMNSKIIDKPMATVWKAALPELGKQFFVINNLDKSSGLINVSYTGDPEKYVDCGRITSYVMNARGKRTYDFPGARAQQSYEVMEPANGLFVIERKMSLDGRVNLVFEEVTPNQTRVTANTRYVVQRDLSIRNAASNFPQARSDTISFNSGAGASFPFSSDGKATECVPTGELEREILQVIKQ